MYPSNPSEYQKFPPPTAPPTEFGQYAQPPPPQYGQPLPPLESHGQYATGVPVQSADLGPWSTGLCDCCSDVPNCCLTFWCPCITFGRIAEIVDKGSNSCGVHGALYTLISLLTGCGCIYSCMYRSKMRQQYMLAQAPCNDCLLHCCCEACALCQEYRELEHRGFDMSIGWEGNMEKRNRGVAMAPVVQGGMTR